MTKRIDYNYHVFGLTQGDGGTIEKCVADGPGNIIEVPSLLPITNESHSSDLLLDSLAKEVCGAHEYYLENMGVDSLSTIKLQNILAFHLNLYVIM